MKKILFVLYAIKIWLLSRYYMLCPPKGTYGGLYRYKDVFGKEAYIAVRNKIFQRAENKIAKKKNKSVRIILVSSSEWCATEIYNYFSRIGIDIAVVLSPYFDRQEEYVRKEYVRSRAFCEKKGFRIIDAFDMKDFSFRGNLRDVQGDVLLYLKSYTTTYAKQTSLENMPLSSISCYIPYAVMLSRGEQAQFNQRCHNMFTYIFAESETHRQMYGRYCDIGNSHVEFSGHPKMDPFAEEKVVDEKRIWKGRGQNSRLRVIYSPHWWFGGGYATFTDNALSILEYAETHADTTSWIYKPHPHLEAEVVSEGYMSAEEYQEYVKRWKELPNAEVYLEGDYSDIFRTSDCIINDSVSFIAEYMYTHKPMLLLQNADITIEWNEFGEQIVNKVYTCKGSDIAGIFNFLENVRNGRDDMKEAREKFFDENLNYYQIRGEKAGEYISRRISEIIEA